MVVPYVQSLVAGAPNEENGKKILDFILSDEGQAIWTNAYLRPARPIELPDEVAARFLPDAEYERAEPVDYARMEEVAGRLRRALPLRSPLRRPGRGAARPARPRPCARFDLLLIAPALIVALAFFALPMARLALVGASGEDGLGAYLSVLTNAAPPRGDDGDGPAVGRRHGRDAGAGDARGAVPGAHPLSPGAAVLVAMLTFPLAFPGVVVGFMVILLAGRQGLISAGDDGAGQGRVVFAYSMAGLFLGYLYFSIPRVLLTVMAGVETIDPALPEAARSLGAARSRCCAM